MNEALNKRHEIVYSVVLTLGLCDAVNIWLVDMDLQVLQAGGASLNLDSVIGGSDSQGRHLALKIR